MRILMLTCHPGIQGPFPKILPLLASSLAAEGCEVTTEPWARRHDRETFFQKVFRIPGDLWRIFRQLRNGRFDLLFVHTTTGWPNYSRDLPLLWLCRHLVPRVVLQFHGSTPELALNPGHLAFKIATRMLLRRTDAVLVLSSEEQRGWSRFYPKARFEIVTNPFQSAHLAPASLNSQVSTGFIPPHGVPVLFYAGRLMEAKGVFDLLDALAQLKDRLRFHLLVAGTGPEADSFAERVRSMGLHDFVTLAGYLQGEELQRAYGSADLFVFPSWSEGFPTVITEAMDAGLPIVTTHLRGMVDHLQQGVHACFVPVRNPTQLADAIAGLLQDEPLRRQMGEANRLKVKDFSPAVVARRYFELLTSISGMNRPAENALPASDAPQACVQNPTI